MSSLRKLVAEKQHYTNVIDTVHSHAPQNPCQFITHVNESLFLIQLMKLEPTIDVKLLGSLIANKNGILFFFTGYPKKT